MAHRFDREVVCRTLLVCVLICGEALLAQPAANPSNVTTYDGPEGHQMVVIAGREFTMGSPVSERGRSEAETPHRVRIPRVYAIATTEVTNKQFNRFLAAVPAYATQWR